MSPGQNRAHAGAGQHVVRAMAWMALGGLFLSTMNALMRVATLEVPPLQSQFMRYVFGTIIMLPWFAHRLGRKHWPSQIKPQIWRGVAQTGALAFFFVALPHIPLADATAIMFTVPIFVLVGAAVFLREHVSPTRWLAAGVGFAGVLLVMSPHFADSGPGWWSFVMLMSAPLFAIAFLITKAMTGHDNNQTIVFWQNTMVTLMTLPLALIVWQAVTWGHVGLLALCGAIGTGAHLCFTRALSLADISAVQPVRFLDLLWASAFGIALFGNSPALTALAGGAVIVAATIMLARRESAAARAAAKQNA